MESTIHSIWTIEDTYVEETIGVGRACSTGLQDSGVIAMLYLDIDDTYVEETIGRDMHIMQCIRRFKRFKSGRLVRPR